MEIKEALNVIKQVIDQSVAEGVFKHSDGVIIVHNAFKVVLAEVNRLQSNQKETPKVDTKEQAPMEVVITEN